MTTDDAGLPRTGTTRGDALAWAGQGGDACRDAGVAWRTAAGSSGWTPTAPRTAPAAAPTAAPWCWARTASAPPGAPPRTARVQTSARTRGEIWHVDGIGRLLRNELLTSRTLDDYRHVDWLYACLSEM